MLATGGTVGIAEELQFAELASQGVIGHQATYQRISKIEQQLDRLGCLKQSNGARQHAQHSSFSAARS